MSKSIKNIVFITLLITFFTFSLNIHALDINNEYLINEEFVDSNEFYMISDMIFKDPLVLTYELFNESTEANTANTAESSLINAYKQYYVDPIDFAEAIENGTGIRNIFPDEYLWIIQTSGGQIIRVVDNDGEWKVAGYMTPSSPTAETKVVKLDKLFDASYELLSNNISLVGNVKCFEIIAYRTCFAYFETNNGEYLIPFSARPDFTGLVNGELYSAEEALEILNENMPLAETTDAFGGSGAFDSNERAHNTTLLDKYKNSNAAARGLLDKADNDMSFWFYIGFGVVSLLTVGCIALIKYKKSL